MERKYDYRESYQEDGLNQDIWMDETDKQVYLARLPYRIQKTLEGTKNNPPPKKK